MSLSISNSNKARFTELNDLLLINPCYMRMGILSLPVLRSWCQYFNLEVTVSVFEKCVAWPSGP
jgi:hypothetical protein